MLEQRIGTLRAEFETTAGEIASRLGSADEARIERDLQALRDRFLSRKSGAVSVLLKSLAELPPERRREPGQALNALKTEIEARLDELRARWDSARESRRLDRERIDVTLPGRQPLRGARHPVTQVREEIENVFLGMGYEIYDGPEVDDDYHCFEALNMPPDHPARDMQDTFYIKGRSDLLLRTHTSTGQIRYMLENPHPPQVRIICPGKVFRRDEEDPTHSQMFHQVEGLVVGPDVTLASLKGTFEVFLGRLFGPELPVRFRSSFFPYTEPSVEVDLGCALCGGAGCRVCKFTGFLEILGSGMVHPAVFEAVNARLGRVAYDPEKISGFAFGMGIERVAFRRYGIDDIRSLYSGDLRFLEQFAS